MVEFPPQFRWFTAMRFLLAFCACSVIAGCGITKPLYVHPGFKGQSLTEGPIAVAIVMPAETRVQAPEVHQVGKSFVRAASAKSKGLEFRLVESHWVNAPSTQFVAQLPKSGAKEGLMPFDVSEARSVGITERYFMLVTLLEDEVDRHADSARRKIKLDLGLYDLEDNGLVWHDLIFESKTNYRPEDPISAVISEPESGDFSWSSLLFDLFLEETVTHLFDGPASDSGSLGDPPAPDLFELFEQAGNGPADLP